MTAGGAFWAEALALWRGGWGLASVALVLGPGSWGLDLGAWAAFRDWPWTREVGWGLGLLGWSLGA